MILDTAIHDIVTGIKINVHMDKSFRVVFGRTAIVISAFNGGKLLRWNLWGRAIADALLCRLTESNNNRRVQSRRLAAIIPSDLGKVPMSRLSTIHPSSASGIASEVYAPIKKAAGMVPNVYATIGTHNPAGLKGILELDKIIDESTLSKIELEAIRLKVSVNAGCDYSIAAHAFLGQFAGLSSTVIENIRKAEPTKIKKIDALLDFVCTLIESRGIVNFSNLQEILNIGYTEKNIIEICLVIASTTFINLVNRTNNTTVDFPKFEHENSAS